MEKSLDSERIEDSLESKDSFKIMSYNLLAPSVTKPTEFHMTDPDHLDVTFRLNLILRKISLESPDILCVQECDWVKIGQHINALGFIRYPQQFYSKASSFGQAIFVREGKFKILSHHHQKYTENMQTFMMLEVESLSSGRKYSIVNTHLKARKTFLDIRIAQMAELSKYINSLCGDVIVCGDMNDEPVIIQKYLLDITENLQYAIKPNGFTLSIQEDYRLELMWVDYILIRTTKKLKILSDIPATDHKTYNVMPSSILPSDHLPQIVSVLI